MSGPELITLGCRLNIAESEAMRAAAADQDDLIIVNSCAVTAEAVRQAKKAIRKAARARPEARIVVTGCAAQIEPDTFAAMPEVARVLGNGEKQQPQAFRFDRPDVAEVHVADIMGVRRNAPHMAAAFADQTRAFVEVQNGCDHRCTFCVIPLGRGPSRSVPAGAVIDRIAEIVDQGQAEVVLTGVDLTSYGPDLPGAPTLGQLVERILRHVPKLQRLRLSSLDMIEIDDRLFDLITGEARIMPHLHLSLQAGDDMILKRMKRRHSRAQSVAVVERLKAKRPDIAIGADLIAGFPTEDDAMAANSLALIDDCDIVFGHIFPYSPRPGTPAARMPQVPRDTIRARAAALREAAERRKADWLRSLVGTVQPVLIERGGTGHAPNFAPVSFLWETFAVGSVQPLRITGVAGPHLTGISE
ncbi:tRNA (N(6)-L-threonylcarbamoyladenosine(37)-C(2))-methylthiotransferase MtaB [Sphingomonas crocodyli]|uniref:tRNA (N(6)-L-threonylcarbamoyladenosine(37)-C(2))-methylthiotransferase MtaB n=1 Tax=Sphingomonas crocodyli TaxID=1979270 RepID=A0A437LWM2_9SPHN|nr:tRNA (N(6)-L-threonylcarbamoyladenosine(37)-C(2))-methylthiotransferase MtaB [Sphingomonas crocodyli]RVT89801.1 tRNA (N(6)-L-threonylcarbamoyladenosine(37)-C(2))-methylthiotransferase MtaB [Sphingomonas crocodyli]